MESCVLRFRPIVMTSLAFILGVVPLAFATGASMNSQRAIGTGGLGVVTATILAVFVTPLSYVLVALGLSSRWTHRCKGDDGDVARAVASTRLPAPAVNDLPAS